jgi:integrase
LFSNSDGWIKVFNTLYLIQGMRWGEIIGLRWSDIDFDSHTINIRDETTRTRSGRPVPLNKLAAAVLTDHLRDQQTQGRITDWVFPSRWDDNVAMNYGSPRKEWMRVIKLAGLSSLGVRPHDLRATAEYYANKLAHFTDMQREKMFGSSIKTQSRHYVTFNAEDIRGLEESVRFDGLESALQSPQLPEVSFDQHGKKLGKRKAKTSHERLKDE